MQHILDHIMACGDQGYQEVPYGEVDFLAFAQFSYLKLKDMVPGMGKSGRGITIRELACHPGSPQMIQQNWFAKENWKLLQLMADSRRYGDILVSEYAECFWHKYDVQFQAVTFQWEDDSRCIIFRGTDETVAGWREDFNLAVAECIPGQEFARTYLHMLSRRFPGKLYLTGHSKGGNLALYAASKSGPEIQQRIAAVYDYDGPDGCLDLKGYERIREKVHKYVPQRSLVGMLLDQKILYQVVRSEGTGLMQHNPYLWQVVNGTFALCRNNALGSRVCSALINDRIASMECAQRKVFIEKLFDIISYPGQKNLFYFAEDWKFSLYLIWEAVKEKRGAIFVKK